MNKPFPKDRDRSVLSLSTLLSGPMRGILADCASLTARRRPFRTPGGALDRISIDVSGVLSATGRERDVAAVELAINWRHR